MGRLGNSRIILVYEKATPIDGGGFVNPNEEKKSLGADRLQQNGTNFIRIHIG